TQLATYIGWLLHKTRGGLFAGTLFILPGLIAIMALSWIYVLFGTVGPVGALLFGLKAAVLAIVCQAAVRLGRRALGNGTRYAVAGAAFVAIFLFDIPFPVIILAAALAGFAASRLGSRAFGARDGGSEAGTPTLLGEALPDHARPGRRWTVCAVLLLLWIAPTAIIAAAAPHSVFAGIALFFSKMAVVTFGGAYAVLAYVAQAAVGTYHWLTPTQMLDGLGLAETTPGPLIMVTQFVGFVGAYHSPGPLPPLLAGTLGGLLTTWVTFVPCFLWIFVGAPYVERLRANRALAAALTAVTAAVVGVILNLALWFALHYLFATSVERHAGPLHLQLPDVATLDPLALALSAAALIAALRFRIGMHWLLGGCALAGLILRTLIPH
ncbi:MAG: chromate transporter, partial [Sphingomonadales bacterium]